MSLEMTGTRSTLQTIDANVQESMGVRTFDSKPRLSPVVSRRDIGRKPIHNLGKLPVHHVVPDPDQPRSQFSEESLEQLAESIRAKGQLSPIRVRWSDELTKWVIVTGERRWRAAQRAAQSTIDCYFHDGELTKSQILEEQLVENLLRDDLHPIEEANAFASLMEFNGWTGKQLATALHIAPSKVSRALALLKLPTDIQQQVADRVIASRSAYEISKLTDDKSRRELAEQAATGRLTNDEASKVVRQRKGKPAPQLRGTKLTFPTEDGWKVIVAANKRGSYYEVEQALLTALDEVRHRIANNVALF